MSDFTPKKAKVMSGRSRIRHSIQMEVEPESEGRLQRVKSQLQHVKSVLGITSRTPMGNLCMIEKLLQDFEGYGQSSGMGRQTPSCSSSSQEMMGQKCRSRDVGIQTDIRDFKQIATADANTAAGSKFPPKGDTAHVRRLQPAVA